MQRRLAPGCGVGQKRKKPEQDATQRCGRCGGSARVAPRKLSGKVYSKLDASLVSVASYNGGEMLHACTGIFIKTLNATTLSVLTSYTLVAYDAGLDYFKYQRRDFSRIDVKLPNGHVVDAELVHSHDYYDLAILNINNVPPGFQPQYLSFDHGVQFEPYIDVVAAWRSHTTGEFNTAMGTLDGIPESYQHYWSSTCKIEAAGLGGALVDYHGKFIGMCSSHGTTTEYLPTIVPLHHILYWLRYFEMLPEYFRMGLPSVARYSETDGIIWLGNSCLSFEPLRSFKQQRTVTSLSLDTALAQEGGYGTTKSSTSKTSETPRYSASEIELMYRLGGEDFANDFYHLATTWGYPLPDAHQACDGMYLKYSFEEEFGENISSILSKRVALKVSRSVVSLASFKGKTRFFACTGVFIGHGPHAAKILTSASLVRDSGDDINHNLRIEVCLPNDRRVKGLLKYCNLRYNIAIVDIMESRIPHGIKLQGNKPVRADIVAVGCLFQDRILMATKGSLIDKNTGWQHQQSCTELSFSTCKITKAGIGGPLIDMRGNIVGMNFYHEECTPFLSTSIILDLLKNDFSKDICTKCLKDGPVVSSGTNRWPVTEPSWCYPPFMPEQLSASFC